ncbi:MAG: hypothetical protein A2787_07795 [Omnitrophica WOR_2 bacterium RIFCSPHIGHO2_01_FULL_48_9]|nr:MAG: hypothetical protein A2787_07795 [Omnitrophica WOR_2 bacterium RIFCSPHIGHO2_01_FULL_48_9]
MHMNGERGPRMASRSEKLSEEPRLSQDFFKVELEFATAAAKIKQIPFTQAIGSYTNIANIFFHDGQQYTFDQRRGALYTAFADAEKYVQVGDLDSVARIVHQTYNKLWTPEKRTHAFGCFSYDVRPDDSGYKPGEIFIHFANRDHVNGGPLSHGKIEKRRQELGNMFTEIKTLYPDENRIVNGNSWLYNLERYVKLFPHD